MNRHRTPLIRSAALLLPLGLLAACSSKKELAKAPELTIDDVVTITVPDLDARGSYRFTMTDGEKTLSADDFDAWMNANANRIPKKKTGPVGITSFAAPPPPQNDLIPSVPFFQITPSSRPMRVKASMARSRCARVWAALICVRMRA